MATRRQTDLAVQLKAGGFDDLDDVMRIMNSAFRPCFGEAWTRSQCLGILPMNGVMMTLAETGRGIAGFSLVRALLHDLRARTMRSGGIEWVLVDDDGRTSVRGLYAAGNVVSAKSSVPWAMASGSMAGAAINGDLVDEDVRSAVAAQS